MSESRTYPCEASAGVQRSGPAPVALLCGKPGKLRTGYLWCEVALCDGCAGEIDKKRAAERGKA